MTSYTPTDYPFKCPTCGATMSVVDNEFDMVGDTILVGRWWTWCDEDPAHKFLFSRQYHISSNQVKPISMLNEEE